MQGIILGDNRSYCYSANQSFMVRFTAWAKITCYSANQSFTVRFTARAKITCSQLELLVASLTAKFSSFRTTVMNLAGSRASEDPRFFSRSVRLLDFHESSHYILS